ncbi:MAG: threonine--tRNA ligase [Nannocystaceae bacterium]
MESQAQAPHHEGSIDAPPREADAPHQPADRPPPADDAQHRAADPRRPSAAPHDDHDDHEVQEVAADLHEIEDREDSEEHSAHEAHDEDGLAAHDHRAIGRRLDLFHQREEAPGMVFWHPAGFDLFERLVAAARRVLAAQGYREVRTPQLLRAPVWEASGHARHFADGMIHAAGDGPRESLKPVSCPGHLYLALQRAPSYRDLPLRYAEFGVVHRNELSGALQGLLRLRQFTQDDGHVLCADVDAARREVVRFCAGVPDFYRAFGFDDLRVALATRPADRAGDDAAWDLAEGALRGALAELGIAPAIEPGGGAFYGPKIEYTLRDRQGRSWQCGTIQFDLSMPGRFDVAFVDADGVRRPPVMLHRALFGSVERFIAVLLEHHGVDLPLWLAPIQAWVLPVSEAQREAAEALAAALRERGVRAEAKIEGTLARRVALANAHGVPRALVLGRRELAEAKVSLRDRGGGQAVLPREAAIDQLARACAAP